MRTRRLDREDDATLVEHLEELRQRILFSLAAVAVATAAAFVFHDRILDLLARPLPPGHRHVVALGVAEPFTVSLAVSVYAGVLLALPVLLWQVWSFFAPALDSAAERRILLLAAFGLVLGAAGLVFGYGILLPRAVHWLTNYDNTHFRLLIRASSYYSFVTSVLLGVVAVFETPVVVLAAVNLGILTSAGLCAGTAARATSSWPRWRSRCRGRIRSRRARAPADVGALRGLDLARRPRRAACREALARGSTGMTRAEWGRLGGFSAGVLLLHALGFGLFLWYLPRNPALTGLATLAYTFGLRHAFDADHIAAIDNTTRKLLQDGRRPLGTGFFFSLGHSTIVFSLTAGLAVAAGTVHSQLPTLQTYGSTIGASVSGTFLLLIGALNLLVLLEVVGVFRRMKRGHYDEQDLERALANQGFLARFLLKRVGSRIDASWKMYPLGVLFGLGFDTATEIALLAVAAGVATHHVPFLAVISLPLIFAAGMSLMDTADGAFMSPPTAGRSRARCARSTTTSASRASRSPSPGSSARSSCCRCSPRSSRCTAASGRCFRASTSAASATSSSGCSPPPGCAPSRSGRRGGIEQRWSALARAGAGAGCSGSSSGRRGFSRKSKSCSRSPRIRSFSRTSGRGSGRPSVFGLSRRPWRKSSSMNLRYASKLRIWWST